MYLDNFDLVQRLEKIDVVQQVKIGRYRNIRISSEINKKFVSMQTFRIARI